MEIQMWSAGSIEITKHSVSATYVTHPVRSLWGPVHAGRTGTIDIMIMLLGRPQRPGEQVYRPYGPPEGHIRPHIRRAGLLGAHNPPDPLHTSLKRSRSTTASRTKAYINRTREYECRHCVIDYSSKFYFQELGGGAK